MTHRWGYGFIFAHYPSHRAISYFVISIQNLLTDEIINSLMLKKQKTLTMNITNINLLVSACIIL